MGVEVPKKKSLIAPLVTTAAVLGIVQGLFWFLLSLGDILFYEKILLPSTGTIGRTIFEIYLNKDNNPVIPEYIIIGPKEFNYFMYLYLVLSFCLLIISSVILWASIRGKSERFYKLRICIWTINLTVLSLLDFILVCLIGHDYGNLNANGGQAIALVAVGIVMTIAARGFVIWIINVIFISILGVHWYDLHKKGTQPDQSILDAYTTGSRPPWDLSNSLYADMNSSGYNNKGFRDDHDNPNIISSSQSFTHLPLPDRNYYDNREKGNQKRQSPYDGGRNNNNNNNNNNWNNRRNQSDNGQNGLGGNNSPLRPFSQPNRAPEVQNQWSQSAPLRTAKIGRQGGQRSPPLNVNPPFIPDPDYSPPGSPRVRGMLRPKTNYAMY